jgi:hypothetical protein
VSRLLVTVGTDGVTDWVKTPDGLRFNLGAISALRFVSSLVSGRIAKRALDAFLADKEAMIAVDEDKMWTLLAPHRAIWSADVSSSMEPQSMTARHTDTSRKGTMTTLSDDLATIERHIQALNEAASKKASNLAEGVEVLKKLAGKIKSPNQSDNSVYYGLGAPKVYEVGDKVARLSYDTYIANTELANTILASTEKCVQVIDKLAAAGKKFNASRAKADVRDVSVKVAGIMQTDLTASWVRGDLDKLAARAEQLSGLFVNAKV